MPTKPGTRDVFALRVLYGLRLSCVPPQGSKKKWRERDCVELKLAAFVHRQDRATLCVQRAVSFKQEPPQTVQSKSNKTETE